MTLDKGISSDDKRWELDRDYGPYKAALSVAGFVIALFGILFIITKCG